MQFLKNPFKGRLSREGYLFSVILLVFSSVLYGGFLFLIDIVHNSGVLSFISNVDGILEYEPDAMFLLLFFVSLLIPFFLIPATVRRLHDINKSGWFAVFILIPLVNIYIALLLLSLSGNAKENTYGEVAQSKSKNPIIIKYILPIILSFIFLYLIYSVGITVKDQLNFQNECPSCMYLF